MKKSSWPIVLLLLIAGAFLVVAAFSAGSWYTRRGAVTPAPPEAHEILHRADPMHAAHSSGRPTGGQAGSDGASSGMSTGSVNISPERQHLIGLLVSPVEKVSGTHVLRLFGRIVPDEGRVYRLNAGIDGFVREVSAATTGSQVKKDDWLATFSAPDFITAIQAYILALNAMDRLKQSGTDISTQVDAITGNPTNTNYQQRLERLQNLGMSALQMEEITRTRHLPSSIKILAPADGFVLARNISPGQKFDRGAEWYRIADLRRVWILADMFENEAQYFRPGVRAQASLPNQRKTLAATVAEVLPQFDAATRTLKVRLEADNPGYVLRPDMFVDVELPVTLPATIAVPVDAVLDSGLKKTVFIERAEGVFVPRQVETGWRFGDRVEIVKGLMLGERIVTAGAFLLDSESRLRPGAVGVDGASGKGKAVHSGDGHAARGHSGH